MTQMYTYFKTKTDVAQNLTDKFLSNFDCGGMGLISEKTEALFVELNEKAESATSSYSAPDNFSQYIYSVLVAKNQKKILSRCLVHEFFFTDINHGY